MSSKRQTTMAKLQREQAVREKRARKQQKKADRKADKLREANGIPLDPETELVEGAANADAPLATVEGNGGAPLQPSPGDGGSA